MNTNKEVAEAFVKAWAFDADDAHFVDAAHLHISTNKYVSYGTPIAMYDTDTQTFVLTSKKYSVTTSKHLNLLKRILESYSLSYEIKNF